MIRLRITFSKTEAMRYTGHLDLHRAWERTFRRARLPLAYSQGFHPQPKLNLACALPLGFTSDAEVLDAWLEQDLSVEAVTTSLRTSQPPGIDIQAIELVDLHLPSLQTQVVSAEYLITLFDPPPNFSDLVSQLMNADHLPRYRRNKSYDLRLLIESLSIEQTDPASSTCLRICMAAREAATGRPEEVLDQLGIQFERTRVRRTRLNFGGADE